MTTIIVMVADLRLKVPTLRKQAVCDKRVPEREQQWLFHAITVAGKGC